MELTSLHFEYNGEKIKNALCIAIAKDIIDFDAGRILSLREVDKYNSFKTESGKAQYLLGRYSAKYAYLKVTSQNVGMKSIEIKNGIFEHPILNNAEFDVSIAHTEEVGAAIVFDKAFPMRIDIERIDSSKQEVLKTITTPSEFENILIEDISALTIAWCFKEALSKALRTGFTIPLELLKAESITKYSDYFKCEFVNFSQYWGYAKIKNNNLLAVVCPKQTNITGGL